MQPENLNTVDGACAHKDRSISKSLQSIISDMHHDDEGSMEHWLFCVGYTLIEHLPATLVQTIQQNLWGIAGIDCWSCVPCGTGSVYIPIYSAGVNTHFSFTFVLHLKESSLCAQAVQQVNNYFLNHAVRINYQLIKKKEWELLAGKNLLLRRIFSCHRCCRHHANLHAQAEQQAIALNVYESL